MTHARGGGDDPARTSPSETPGGRLRDVEPPAALDPAAETPVRPAGTTRPGKRPGKSGKLKPTRISGTWVAVIVALIVLALLLIFILQNLDSATVHFFGASGSMPLAVAMLFSVLAGAALVALIGGARILQLRKQARRRR
ncbi:lipopolysaccharide assembly LapA domain-containing protein [Amycolatopsis sp. NPDC059027]|uniref:LapA family protein n=1 Tax=unclassified Amycolatopsis TaxID=2618356 RepID=UPI00367328CD